MISEKVIHECIFKLMTVKEKSESTVENHLELVCKLLITIGKDLDHIDAKVNQNPLFNMIFNPL